MSSPRPANLAFAALVAATGALVAPPLSAQSLGDRQLLSTQGGDPYVMILFDASGSMNWATACSAEDRAAGRCNHICATPTAHSRAPATIPTRRSTRRARRSTTSSRGSVRVA